ncbi:glycerophosphodiester phosphodiesterase family protein [Hyphomonas sp.]|uniref:glycerophosphodiester phosphodiesterase family protein n=1 Tax=Hyphomonas sp. TaxID=87 RepID=UPI001BCC19BF|nr:glycerophosphodiester phosphodiesterase family protein [Hyphomonas sp.]
MCRLLVMAVSALVLAACSETPAAVPAESATEGAADAATDTAAPAPAPVTAGLATELPALFDCLRETGGVVVAAHRGGFAPGYPENALETMQYTLERGIRVFEVDVAESRDGVLFLHHDDRFGRTIEGEGYNSDTDWSAIAGKRLKDIDGKVTAFNPPSSPTSSSGQRRPAPSWSSTARKPPPSPTSGPPSPLPAPKAMSS